jgi:nucleoside-diphosphate-sugar epimerase
MTPQLYAGKSRTIAIAGAAGGVGQHIAEALLSAGFQVVLLLRKVRIVSGGPPLV